MFDMGSNRVALKSMANNRFVCVDPLKMFLLNADQGGAGQRETFVLAVPGQGATMVAAQSAAQPVTQPAVVVGAMPGTAPVAGIVANGQTVACAPKISIRTQIDEGWVKATYGASAMATSRISFSAIRAETPSRTGTFLFLAK